MTNFSFNVAGQLNSMRLAESKALWPLFETVVNSIQSIEESPNQSCGEIEIFAARNEYEQINADGKAELGEIVSFTVTDNGVGFNTANYDSFLMAYSTYKINKGCKGIGRFLWLLAFENVQICSCFSEGNKPFKREFVFSKNGVAPELNLTEESTNTWSTAITLNGYIEKYRSKCPVHLEPLAKKIIEHCLPFFILDSCPHIVLKDGKSENVDLNQYYLNHIKPYLHQDKFTIEDQGFTLYHLKVFEGFTQHELHLCANQREVETIKLSERIPDLQKRIMDSESDRGFYYLGYVTSEYLDSNVSTNRTMFEFDETGGQLSLNTVTKTDIVESSTAYIKTYLYEYLEELNKEKKESINKYVSEVRPQYGYLLSNNPDVYDSIPVGLSHDKLELALHKEEQAWERRIKVEGVEVSDRIKNGLTSDSTFQELFHKYCSSITEISRASLSEYVVRRKVLIDVLERTLTVKDNGKFNTEDKIHTIVCPMRFTSSEIEFEEMNLWMIDERLAYHSFLASDKTIRSFPFVESTSTKEPDITIYDRAMAFSDGDAPYNSITIIEFKKPDNDKGDPFDQVYEYIEEIKTGRKKQCNGLSFGSVENVAFYCYIIADFTPKMHKYAKKASLRLTQDGGGYFGYNETYHAYVELISYPKLLKDAKKRNQVLFDKLFAPKAEQLLSFQNTKITEKNDSKVIVLNANKIAE